jgi:hypothetical protein
MSTFNTSPYGSGAPYSAGPATDRAVEMEQYDRVQAGYQKVLTAAKALDPSATMTFDPSGQMPTLVVGGRTIPMSANLIVGAQQMGETPDQLVRRISSGPDLNAAISNVPYEKFPESFYQAQVAQKTNLSPSAYGASTNPYPVKPVTAVNPTFAPPAADQPPVNAGQDPPLNTSIYRGNGSGATDRLSSSDGQLGYTPAPWGGQLGVGQPPTGWQEGYNGYKDPQGSTWTFDQSTRSWKNAGQEAEFTPWTPTQSPANPPSYGRATPAAPYGAATGSYGSQATAPAQSAAPVQANYARRYAGAPTTRASARPALSSGQYYGGDGIYGAGASPGTAQSTYNGGNTFNQSSARPQKSVLNYAPQRNSPSRSAFGGS